ncbi:hypothetical protein Dimus_028411 [Dionaea muscipula]
MFVNLRSTSLPFSNSLPLFRFGLSGFPFHTESRFQREERKPPKSNDEILDQRFEVDPILLLSRGGFDPNPKSSPSSIPRVSHFRFRKSTRFPSGVLNSLKLKFSARARDGGGNYEVYEDKAHLEYYYGTGTAAGERKGRGRGRGREKGDNKGWNTISTKKRMKLVDCLVKDLSTFSELGFGLDSIDGDGVDSDPKAKIISEAAELLLAQLKQLREEEKELKETNKKEKLKTAQMGMKPECESSSSSSSSSSSESSDSECVEVVDMAQLKRYAINDNLVSQVQNVLDLGDTCCTGTVSAITNNAIPEVAAAMEEGVITTNDSIIPELSSPIAGGSNSISIISDHVKNVECRDDASSLLVKKVEVCMGGKCKKLGAAALVEEFQRVIGLEAAVVGCKCLGKCKSAPNVRVTNSDQMDDHEAEYNPLCIGVSLDDVGVIVAKYLGTDEVNDYRVAAA